MPDHTSKQRPDDLDLDCVNMLPSEQGHNHWCLFEEFGSKTL
jgi:hypothetical protein